MGVYIANMAKPKDCKECQWHLDFYIEVEQVGGLCTITEKDDRENTCPLIEIEEWNSYSNGKIYAPKGTFQKIYDEERRNDE